MQILTMYSILISVKYDAIADLLYQYCDTIKSYYKTNYLANGFSRQTFALICKKNCFMSWVYFSQHQNDVFSFF